MQMLDAAEISKLNPEQRTKYITDLQTELSAAKEAAKSAVGVAKLEVLLPSGDFKNHTIRMTVPGTKAIVGGRAKYAGIIEAVKSGSLEAFLTAHPEVK